MKAFQHGWGLAAHVAGAVFLVAPGAHALLPPLQCETECAKGFSCQAVEHEDCAPTGCPPGQECMPGKCETTTTFECVALPCTTDGDCAEGMACAETKANDCGGQGAPACGPDESCPPAPPPPDCNETTKKTCVPRYHLPCKVAADCGGGWQCEPIRSCGCTSTDPGDSASGSSGDDDPAPRDDSSPPPPPDDCECRETGASRCTADLKTCNTDADCTAPWTCVEFPQRGGVEPGDSDVDSEGSASPPSPGGTDPSDNADVPPGGNGGIDAPPPEPPTVVRYCAPPYYDIPHDRDSGAVIGKASDDGASPEAPGENGTGKPTSGAEAPDDDGGCQVSAGHSSSSAAMLLGALGLAGLVRRRLRRAAQA